MERVNVGIIGTGWCGGIRAETAADSPFVNELHIAENRPERLAEIRNLTHPTSATTDYRELIDTLTTARSAIKVYCEVAPLPA